MEQVLPALTRASARVFAAWLAWGAAATLLLPQAGMAAGLVDVVAAIKPSVVAVGTYNPTGMKTGVSTTPRLSLRLPRRA